MPPAMKDELTTPPVGEPAKKCKPTVVDETPIAHISTAVALVGSDRPPVLNGLQADLKRIQEDDEASAVDAASKRRKTMSDAEGPTASPVERSILGGGAADAAAMEVGTSNGTTDFVASSVTTDIAPDEPPSAEADTIPSPQTKLQQDAPANKTKKNQKIIFPYGNYTGYYGYRVGRTLEADPRMKLMQEAWFKNKDVLDIGCNEGHVTISLVQKYRVRSMCGVDIDPGLIHKAWNNLHYESGLPGEETVERLHDWSDYVHKNGGYVSDLDNGDEIHCPGLPDNEASVSESDGGGLQGTELLKRVMFKNANFLHCNWRRNTVDTVLCLSVVKWIHLNWGDEGVLEFFITIYRMLRPGGVLILEPQPWSSYARKCRVSEVCRQNFRQIVLRPEHFPGILLEQIGFKSCEQITLHVPESTRGFSRPLYLCSK